MIRKPYNWESVQAVSDREKLPLGAYVCKIRKCAVQKTDYGDQLALLFDIDEGDYKGFYDRDFRINQNPDKRWRGVLRQFLPKDNGSEADEWTKSTFKGLITSFERSNPGCDFDWDESWFVGKRVGILYRNEEWQYNGKTGWAVRPFRAISVDSVVEGSYTLPKDKPLKNRTVQAETMNGFVEVEDDDLPF